MSREYGDPIHNPLGSIPFRLLATSRVLPLVSVCSITRWGVSMLTRRLAIFAPLWGTVADKHGRKPLLVSGLSAFTLASLAIGLSKSLWMAIAARCVCK